MKRSLLRLALLLLPTLVLTGWALSIPWLRAGQPEMRVRLVGYDPRDLLRGHYLLARLDIENLPPGRYGEQDCICLLAPDHGTGRPGFTPLQSCATEVLAACPFPLADPGRELRLYQPAEGAQRLEALLRDGKAMVDVRLRFDGAGGVALDDLRVDGKQVDQITEGER